MKRIISIFLSVGYLLEIVAALLLILSPYIGLAFSVSIIVSVIGMFVSDILVFGAYFSVAWKIYFVMAVFSFFVFVTFQYQNCCFGLKGFAKHLSHSLDYLFGNLLSALIWPWSWYKMDVAYSSWGLPWGQIVCNAFHHWFVDAWKGARYESINAQTGEVREGRIKP